MPETLPGTVMDPTPEILWHGIDSPEQLSVIQGGVRLETALTWIQTRLSREGVRTRVFLDYVPENHPFEIAVTTPEARTVQLSLRDGDTEFVHQGQAEAGVEQGILRFSKSQGRSGWLVSPSYLGGTQELKRTAEETQTLTPVEERLVKTPQEYRRDTEALLRAIPVLTGGIDEVCLVLDVSASMRGVLTSSALDQFAALGWCLGYAAGDVAKTTVLVGDTAKRTPIDRSLDAPGWVARIRAGLTGGMATGWPLEVERVVASAPDRVAILCLTDAPPVPIPQMSARAQRGWTRILVWDSAPDQARVANPALWNQAPTPTWATAGWNGADRLISVMVAADGGHV